MVRPQLQLQQAQWYSASVVLNTTKLQTYKVRVPTSVGLSSKKNWILNLNNYRNAHYQILNKAKINFKTSVTKEIHQLPEFTNIELIEYKLYRNTKRHCDVANICSIVDKFFCDALVEAGKLPDDNFEYLKNITYSWGGLTDSDSYVDITLKGITKMELVSKITLDKNDVTSAIKDFVIKSFPQFKDAVTLAEITLDKELNCAINLDSRVNEVKSVPSVGEPSGVPSTGSVQDIKPERQAETAVGDGEAEKPADESSIADKPAADKTDAAPAEAKPVRKNLFARPRKTAETNSADSGVETPSNPDTESANKGMEVAEEPAMEPEVKAASIGASIFGRKKVA